MSFKPFAVHFVLNRSKHDNAKIRSMPRGFTAWISPCDESDRDVNFQVTHCAYHDDFSKKEGRRIAQATPPHIVNKRDVPEMLASSRAYVFGERQGIVKPHEIHNYQYIWKYLL